MDKIEAYRTRDGHIFSTLEEAQNHESEMAWGIIISEYMGSTYCTYRQPQLGMVRKTIISWEKFKAEQGLQEKVNAICQQAKAL